MRIIASILLIGVLVQGNGLFWSYLWFESEREILTETLCVNKDLPELQCFARCQFQAAVEQEHEQHSGQLPQTEELQRIWLFMPVTTNCYPSPVLFAPAEASNPLLNGYRFSVKTTCLPLPFRPPIG